MDVKYTNDLVLIRQLILKNIKYRSKLSKWFEH